MAAGQPRRVECRYCGERFIALRSDAKFCSPAHRVAMCRAVRKSIADAAFIAAVKNTDKPIQPRGK